MYRAYYMKKYESQDWENANYDLSVHEEVGDHGILGGYLLFDKLYSSEQKNNQLQENLSKHSERIPLYQDICYRIMEHNIWKDYGDGPDFEEISGNNFKKIGISEPLLYLLSLVDTIEMTKKFCKYKDDGNEKEHFVFPKTLGKKVFLTVYDDRIEINYRELRKCVQEHQYKDSFSDWEVNVKDMGQWIQIEYVETGISKDIITLKKVNQESSNDITEINFATSK